MIPSPYTEKSLKQEFRVGDSGRWKIDVEANIDAITQSAHARATSVLPTLTIKSKLDHSGKTLYFASDIETALILRATYRRLAHQYSVTLPNRDDILNGIVEATSEASPYLVTKCDILDFYGNLNAKPIITNILSSTRTSPELKAVIDAIYKAAGLSRSVAPRGLSISALIAELALKDFDQKVRRIPGVHRYFRYADDIIAFSTPNTSVVSLITKYLNSMGLSLNDKTELITIDSQKKSEILTQEQREFTYLGYEFSAFRQVGTFCSRKFQVSIAPTKVLKRKTRAFTALHAFSKDGDASLLVDRLKYLTTNRQVYKTRHSRGSRKQKIRTGMHYNYAKCGTYPEVKRGRTRDEHNPVELIKLDVALHTALFSLNSDFNVLIRALPIDVLDELSSISFAQGFKKRIMKRFTRKRVGQICRVWGNE